MDACWTRSLTGFVFPLLQVSRCKMGAESKSEAVTSPSGEPESDPKDPSQWLERYGDALYAQAFYFTKNPEDAEDAVQEAMARGIRALDSFQGRSSIKTWLSAILRNVLLERYRRQSRNPVMTFEDSALNEEVQAADQEAAKSGLDPMMQIDRIEFWEAMSHCLSKLPEQAAQVFWMKEVQGVSTSELEHELGLSRANIWVTVHRARKGLRECLADRFGRFFFMF